MSDQNDDLNSPDGTDALPPDLQEVHRLLLRDGARWRARLPDSASAIPIEQWDARVGRRDEAASLVTSTTHGLQGIPHDEGKDVYMRKTTQTSGHSSSSAGIQGRLRTLAATGVAVAVIGLFAGAIYSFTPHKAGNIGSSPATTTLAAKLQCSVSYGQNTSFLLARPVLDWSANGTLAEWHAHLKLVAGQTCASHSLNGQGDANGIPVWSPDGKRLLLVTGDVAQVRDAATGQVLATLQLSQSQQFGKVAWTADGAQIVSATIVAFLSHTTPTEAVQVWNASTGALVRTVMTDEVLIGSTTVSPDGKYFALQKADQGVQVREVETGKLVSTIPVAKVRDVVWSRDGASLAAVVFVPHANETTTEVVQVWSTATGQQIAAFEDPTAWEGDIGAVAFSPDGRYLAESSSEIHIWDVKTQRLVATFGKVATKEVSSDGAVVNHVIAALAWASDGHTLASVTGSDAPGDLSTPRLAPVQEQDTLNIWQLS